MIGVQEWVRQTVRVWRAPRGGEVLLSLSYPELSLSLEQLSHHREQRANTGRGFHQPLSQPALGPPALCLVGNRGISSNGSFPFWEGVEGATKMDCISQRDCHSRAKPQQPVSSDPISTQAQNSFYKLGGGNVTLLASVSLPFQNLERKQPGMKRKGQVGNTQFFFFRQLGDQTIGWALAGWSLPVAEKTALTPIIHTPVPLFLGVLLSPRAGGRTWPCSAKCVWRGSQGGAVAAERGVLRAPPALGNAVRGDCRGAATGPPRPDLGAAPRRA